MPNLVVYVPAKMWARLEDELGTEFPAWARQMTVKHMQEFLDGRLSERGEVLRGNEPERRPAQSADSSVDHPRSESRHITPDFKPVRK